MADKLGKDFRSITRADLQRVTFDNPFGITTDGKAQTTEVPKGKGLPISRAITNIEIADHVADTEIEAKDKVFRFLWFAPFPSFTSISPARIQLKP